MPKRSGNVARLTQALAHRPRVIASHPMTRFSKKKKCKLCSSYNVPVAFRCVRAPTKKRVAFKSISVKSSRRVARACVCECVCVCSAVSVCAMGRS
ncbi:unnamed protein product [Plutella xylostella]|uniref:(diamondback moth) hypothetical protein n=1 Tax=Plutella xylostella TaxID=51655 RepID=A0A8S4FG78_PLUXY|nr:unnamed protein product [Plutella xylostella]